jgi:hypothetical protein
VLTSTPSRSSGNNFWRKDNAILLAFLWTGFSLIVYLFLSGPIAGVERPLWYRALTGYICQDVPLLVGGVLCLRNALARKIPSGTIVWWLMGIAILSYLLGNIFFTSWELVWGLNSTGCLGDPFFVFFYVLMSMAMVLLIARKGIWLKFYQWAIVAIISSVAVYMLVTIIPAPTASEPVPQTTAATAVAETAPAEDEPDLSKVPSWVAASDRFLKPYGKNLNLFYVWSDIGLLAMSLVMLLGFWGGKLSTAWQVTAQGLACFYVADMWYAYAGNNIDGYQSGFMLEMFWVFGSVQFAVAAAIEFDYMWRQHKNKLTVDS